MIIPNFYRALKLLYHKGGQNFALKQKQLEGNNEGSQKLRWAMMMRSGDPFHVMRPSARTLLNSKFP
ncbi:MAG: hypothetical protein Q7S89_01615 [bacterium]|nr:hypothetical protein [bacterium]